MRSVRAVLVVVLAMALSGLGPQVAALAQGAQPDPAQVNPDPWPKSAQKNGATYTMYQPQLDSWDGYNLEVHAAVSVQPAGAKYPTFGAIVATATTLVDRQARTVSVLNITIQKANFPSAPTQAPQYQAAIQALVSAGSATLPLDRLQAAVAVLGAKQQGRAVTVKNAPPNFVFSQSAAVLVSIAGQASWSAVPNTSLSRVTNTRALILQDASGTLYLHLFDGFIQASTLAGPWTIATQVPQTATTVAQQLASKNLVDLMAGPTDEKGQKTASLQNGVPTVYVETVPTELIVFQGKPDWVTVPETNLLYVKNTTGNVFMNVVDQQTYVLVTGRWFSGPGLTGPWQYVSGKNLPPDFAKIPDDSPKENVKASVPGTAQAQEAIIAAGIPQSATVYRAKVQFTPQVSGTPQLKPITDTPLSYVFNSADPIIEVSPTSWYAVHDGVWFTAASLGGPWSVASSVPAVIYSIPPSSPLYYVTYVQIYASTSQYVIEGYTPGYMGTFVTADGVIVYGTGYDYPAYYSPLAYYPGLVTYGYATDLTWTPWTGWAFGFAFGWAWGAAMVGAWGWGAAPYWGAYGSYYHGAYGYHGAVAWGPAGWAGTTGNVYHQWGATSAVSRTSAGYNAWTGNAWSSKVGTSYNSVTGRSSAGQRAGVANVYTGGYAYGTRGATYNPNTGTTVQAGRGTVGNAYTGQSTTAGGVKVTGPQGQTAGVAHVGDNVYADHDGNVYKSNPDSLGGFQQLGHDGGWSNVQSPAKTQELQSNQYAQSAGDARSASSSWGGNWGSSHTAGAGASWGGGSFSGGDRAGGGGGFGGFHGGGGVRR